MGYSNYSYQDTQGMIAKSFKVKVSPDDKMVTILNGNTILTTLSMKLTGNQLSLIGKNDMEISNIEIPNINGVTNVSYDEIKKDLVISLSGVDGTTKELRVSLKDLVDIYTAGDGINIENKSIRIKLNETESYLSVNAEGLAVNLSELTTKLDETFATDTDVTNNTSKITKLENDKFDKSNISTVLPEDSIGVDTKVMSEKLVVAELNKKQVAGDYATKTELSTETNRATAAETSLSEKLESYKTSSVVTVEALGSPEGGAAKTYVVKQGGNKVGESINIPKDMVVQSGAIAKGTWDRDRTIFTPSEEGSDIALKLTVGNGNPVYVDVKQLVDAYTGKDGISVSNLNEISVKINPVGNEYLSVDASGLKVSGINEAISNAINELNVADAAVATQYVSAVSQTDGEINVTRASLPVIGDATKSGTSTDSHVKVDVTTTKGVVSAVAVTSTDIASAATVQTIKDAYFAKANVTTTVPSDGVGVDTKVMSEKLVVAELNKKQATLVSGTNIKTINGVSILGGGNIDTPKTVIVNELTTGGADKALSAEQGKVLQGLVDGKQPKGDYATKTELTTSLGKKQDTLVSGTNIKTVNGESILGSGNIVTPKTAVIDNLTSTDIDKALSANQGKALKDLVDGKQPTGDYATKAELSQKQATLVSGTNIKTVNGASILGSGNIDTPKTAIVNDLATGGTDKALSAEQGKVLKGEVDGKQPKGEYALSAELVNKQDKLLYGAFSNKPVKPKTAELYFCTDKQTTEGQTNGILIIWNGTTWTDMLGRAIN